MSLKLSKTAIRELKKLYCAALIATVAGIALVSTSANATIMVEEGTTDITDDVLAAVYADANAVQTSPEFSVSSTYRVDGKSTLDVTSNPIPVAADYQFDFDGSGTLKNLDGNGDGTDMYKSLISVEEYTTLSDKTDGTLSGDNTYNTAEIARDNAELYTQGTSTYKFSLGATSANDPTVADALNSNLFQYASTKAGTNVSLTTSTVTETTNGLLDATANLAYTGYSYTSWSGDTVALDSNGPDMFSYTFTNSSGNPDSLGNYYNEETGNIEIPAEEGTYAATAFGHYNTDSTAYKAEKLIWSADNTAYQAAVSNYNSERAAFNDLADAYDNAETGYAAGYTAAGSEYAAANGRYQSADAAYETDAGNWTTTNTNYGLYDGTLAQTIDTRANNQIATAVQEGGAIYNAVSSGISDLIADKEVKLSADIGYNLANPDHETTGLVARLDALTAESSDKTLVGAINTNTAAIANETTRATGVEANLATAINNETNRATVVEDEIKANIGTTEDGAYVASANTVGQNINALDAALAAGDNGTYRKAAAYTDARFNQLDHKIDKLEDKMEKGLAANAALAGLTPLSSEHKTQLSAAMGGYGSNQAVAVGAYHYITDSTLLNAGAAYGGNSDISYKVGITFGF